MSNESKKDENLPPINTVVRTNDFTDVTSAVSPLRKEESPEPEKKNEENTKAKESIPFKQGRLQWTDQTEELLSSWADIAACYKWLHESSFRKYSSKNYWFAVPVIVLSTIAGTLSVSITGYVPTEFVSFAQAGIGAMNIFTGILTTLQSLFKYAQTSESHNNVSIGWSKLQRNISIELSVNRESRKDADSFIKICRSEYDRLIEQSPTISTDVIELFKTKFAEQSDNRKSELRKRLKRKQKLFLSKGMKEEADKIEEEMDVKLEEDELILPDICDSIQHTKIYRESINGILPNDIEENLEVSPMFYQETVKKILPEVRDALIKERYQKIEEKISGVNQYKLSLMGERMAPIMNEIIDTKEKEIDKLIHKQIETKVRTRALSEPWIVEEEKEIVENLKKPVMDKLYSVNYKPPQMNWTSRPQSKTVIEKPQLSGRKSLSANIPSAGAKDRKKEVLKELEEIKNKSKVKNMLNMFNQNESDKEETSTPNLQSNEKEWKEKTKQLGIPLLDLTDAYKQVTQEEEFHDNKTKRSDCSPKETEPESPEESIHIKINIPD